MTSRTTESIVTFRHEFNLSPLDGPQPAGTYRVVIEEDEIPGLSFIAFRRASTRLYVPALAGGTCKTRVFSVEQTELQAALNADKRKQSDDKEHDAA